jgi:hypothetical protein
VQEAIWAETFKYMADNKVMFEGILLKPAMVTPGADSKKKESPETVAAYTLKMLRRRVPPAVPGIMFLSGGQSELEATLNLNAMNQSPNPWHVSFSYARALQNSVLKTWQGKPENAKAAQEALLKRAKANSDAQLGKYDASGESAGAGERTYEKGVSAAGGRGVGLGAVRAAQRWPCLRFAARPRSGPALARWPAHARPAPPPTTPARPRSTSTKHPASTGRPISRLALAGAGARGRRLRTG